MSRLRLDTAGLNLTVGDARYLLKSGDTMTGPLVVTDIEITAFGTITDAGTALAAGAIAYAYNHAADTTQAHPDYLLNNAADEFGGTLSPDTDEVYDLGTTVKGLRQLVFSDAYTGLNRAAFRGCKCIGYAAGDIYWGVDDIYPGYYVQKTVVAGSTKTDNTDDYTNLYQGNSAYPYIVLNYTLAHSGIGADATAGILVSDLNAGVTSPIIFGPSVAGCRFEMFLDATNKIMYLEGSKAAVAPSKLKKIQFRVNGVGAAIRPHADDTIDLGESDLEWKDLYVDGTAAIDICRVDEQLIVPSGTADPASTVGSLFLRTDIGTNGTLRMYANGAWRTVATL